MIVYGAHLSPYVRKVLAFAAEKGVSLESRGVNLGSRNPDFREASPFAKMPALRDGDFLLSDSTAIVFYIEALSDLPNLIPIEARSRARTVWFDKFSEDILTRVAVKLFFNRVVSPRFLGREGNLEAARCAENDELPPVLNYLEQVVPTSGFLVEDRLTLADIAVVSPFLNLEYAGYRLDPQAYPTTQRYVASILARPSFAQRIEGERALLAD